jgi:hypothetical protein
MHTKFCWEIQEHILGDNIKMELKYVRREDVKLIQLAHEYTV